MGGECVITRRLGEGRSCLWRRRPCLERKLVGLVLQPRAQNIIDPNRQAASTGGLGIINVACCTQDGTGQGMNARLTVLRQSGRVDDDIINACGRSLRDVGHRGLGRHLVNLLTGQDRAAMGRNATSTVESSLPPWSGRLGDAVYLRGVARRGVGGVLRLPIIAPSTDVGA